MPTKISEEVTQLGKSCRFLLTALVKQGPQVSETLLEKDRPLRQEGDEEPGFFSSITGLGRRLGSSMQQLFEADGKVYDAHVRLKVLRDLRDDLTQALALAIVRLRRLLLSHYEDPALEALGLFSPRVRVPDPLIRQADTIERTFAGDDLPTLLGEPAHEGETIDREDALVQRPIETAAELRSTLVEVDEARRVLDEKTAEKDGIKKEHEEVFVYTARSFEANCRLAGFRRLAEKVRPSERQPGRRAAEVEDVLDTAGSDPPPASTSPSDEVPDTTGPTP